MCFDIGIVTSGPNEAIIISGLFKGNEPEIIVGGRAIVCPCIQKVQRLPLSTQTLIIESPRVYTSQGVPISVTGVAQVITNNRIWVIGVFLRSFEVQLACNPALSILFILTG